MKPDQDDYLDDEPEDPSPRSIFSAGWFRAVLVLVVLAIVVVVSLPYLLDWFEPSQPKTTSAPQPRPPAQSAPAPPVAAPAPAPAPAPAVVPPIAQPKPETAQPAPATPPAPPPARAETPAAPEARPPKPETKDAPAVAAKPSAPARSGAAQKTARAESKVQAPRGTPAPEKAAPDKKPVAPRGDYWIQLGAFQDKENADRLARALQTQQFQVEVARVTRGAGGDSKHELFVTGSNAEAVGALLRGGGSTAEPAPGGVVVRPALSLRDAVALSRRLAAEGLNVKIRRVGTGSDATYHLVRVGGFGDREHATAARKDLEAKGHVGFITQGPAK